MEGGVNSGNWRVFPVFTFGAVGVPGMRLFLSKTCLPEIWPASRRHGSLGVRQ